MQCEGETDDGELKYSNTMPAQNSHTVCVHLYHLEHSRTAPRPPRDRHETNPSLPPSPLPLGSHPHADCNSSWKFMYKLT